MYTFLKELAYIIIYHLMHLVTFVYIYIFGEILGFVFFMLKEPYIGVFEIHFVCFFDVVYQCVPCLQYWVKCHPILKTIVFFYWELPATQKIEEYLCNFAKYCQMKKPLQEVKFSRRKSKSTLERVKFQAHFVMMHSTPKWSYIF